VRLSREEGEGMMRNAWLRGSTFGVTALTGLFASSAFAANDGNDPSGLPQLDVHSYPTQIFWLIVAFVVLYAIMSKVALPKIAEVLEERQERIADDIETAERLRSEAAAVQAEYEKALAGARGKAQELFRETADVVAKEHAEAEAEAAKKLNRKTKTAETRIGKQRDEALESLRAVASETAAAATAKLIGVEPSAKAVEKAVEAAAGGAS
jgi:F-type H+-transporting ATPase subunit b